jgi:hypothetical protein
MRGSDWLVGLVALLGGGLASTVVACSAGHTCENYPTEGCPGVGTTTTTTGSGGTGTGGSTGGTGGSTGGSGGMTTTTTPPIDCSGDPLAVSGSAGNIRDECAVFVKSGATGGDGSMASPLGSIAEAISKTSATRPKVFVCTPAGTPLQEEVSVAKADVEIFGGFDCAGPDWSWTEAGRSDVMGPADKVAWTVTDTATNSLVSGFKITAASPSNPTGGGHSIGMVLADVSVSVRRCDVVASDAANGASPTTPTDPVGNGADSPAVIHAQMDACINLASLIAGPEGVTNCGGVDTNGGKGGKGGDPNVNNGDGSPGSPGMPVSAVTGLGGTGQTTTGTPPASCTGGLGASGDEGPSGSAGTVLGTLSAVGLTGGDGGNGGPGLPGQGGGGGGAAKAGMFCAGGTEGNGASGGGGGAGGCGGKGGPGGQAGGSSIAIISLGNSPKIDGMTVTLKTGKGGTGGKGAAGQAGGMGGVATGGGASSGMSPSKAGCTGGNGGSGGDGGPGGGGRGGHSIGIAFPGAPPANLTFTTPPAVGMAGNGGTSTGNAGANGQAGAVCDFSKSSNPCM